MLTILYFAAVRKHLGQEQDKIPWSTQLNTLAALKQHLNNTHPQWHTLSSQSNLLAAVNQQIADDSTPIKDQDEIAFFQPMTGG